MKVFFAADHAGFELKGKLMSFVCDGLGFETEDCGAYEFDPKDDYPPIIEKAARHVAEDPTHTRAIIVGGSGQGEAIVANRFRGVRAVVYYGPCGSRQVDIGGNELDIIASTRIHNDANMLSIGARFMTEREAKDAVRLWLETTFRHDERHVRRINQIEEASFHE